MARRNSVPGDRPPLGEADLRALALAYVARYASSTGKLLSYLNRKLRERGWEGDSPPPLESLISDFVERGYLDDQAFATNRAEGLKRRGFGEQRVRMALRQSGVPGEMATDAARIDPDQALIQVLLFARRKKIGPFSQQLGDPRLVARWSGQLARAGHPHDIANKLLRMDRDVAMALLNHGQGHGKQD